jgi:hypothetical protein
MKVAFDASKLVYPFIEYISKKFWDDYYTKYGNYDLTDANIVTMWNDTTNFSYLKKMNTTLPTNTKSNQDGYDFDTFDPGNDWADDKTIAARNVFTFVINEAQWDNLYFYKSEKYISSNDSLLVWSIIAILLFTISILIYVRTDIK